MKGDKMRDICVDFETTNTDANHGAILQIGAVRFDLFSGEIGDVFKLSLKVPHNRYWSEGTRAFWNQRADLYKEITSEPVEPREGFIKFVEWVNKSPDPHFWAKPVTFDFNWVQSYCDQYDIKMPFAFWKARDIRSFMLGVYAPRPLPKMSMKVDLVEHDALNDALSEAKWAIDTYKEKVKYEQRTEERIQSQFYAGLHS